MKLRPMTALSAAAVSLIAIAVAGAAARAQSNPAYDGVYSGGGTIASQAMAADSHWHCAPSKPDLNVRINSGRVLFRYTAEHEKLELTGSVGSDGVVSAYAPSSAGGVKLAAKILGSSLTGTAGSGGCIYNLQLQKH